MWDTAHYGDQLCPYFKSHNVQVAGLMDCHENLTSSPPCLCTSATGCGSGSGPKKRKMFVKKQDPNSPVGCGSTFDDYVQGAT